MDISDSTRKRICRLKLISRAFDRCWQKRWLRLISSFILGLSLVSIFWIDSGAGVAKDIGLSSPENRSLSSLSTAPFQVNVVPLGHLNHRVAPLFIDQFPQAGWSQGALKSATPPLDDTLQAELNRGRNTYESGNLEAAATILEDVWREAQARGTVLGQAIALSNLALVRGQQGQWTEANQLVVESLALLLPISETPDINRLSVQAQTLNIQGRLELGQGRAEAAYATWGEAATLFRQIGNRQGEIRSQIRQARALQAQGYHQRAVKEILQPLRERLQNEQDSLPKVMGLLSLGEALQTVRNLDAAQEVTHESRQIAKRLEAPEAIALSQLALGNLAYAQAKAAKELEPASSHVMAAAYYYDEVIKAGADNLDSHQLWAMLNKFSLLTASGQAEAAVDFWHMTLQPLVDRLPTNRDGIYARLDLGQNLSCLKQPATCSQSFTASSTFTWEDIKQILVEARQQASDLGDQRAMAYALGYLGKFYEDTNQLARAQDLTNQALLLAKSVNATDITYRWYEQSGRLMEKQGDSVRAIAAYSGAVQTLKTLRSDLIAINPEIQFSFEESVEPIHRKLVDLLLKEDSGDDPERLERARLVIESLQVEELNNFLQAACLDGQKVPLEEVVDGQNVAVIYPILLDDRIETIVRLPQQELHRYTSLVPRSELVSLTEGLQAEIGTRYNSIGTDFLEPATQLYDLLIRPLADDLAESTPETLVFVLDGELRNIPMAALFDGDTYLIEHYAIALAPGLQLVDPRPLQDQRLSAVTFGISEERPAFSAELPNFSALPSVVSELNAIGQILSGSKDWLNEEFTREQFKQTITNSSEPIIHLATHAQFGSQLDETFILSWDGKISVNDLSTWIQASDRPIELLVLSACETATTGDRRAALGLAGMAVRAGARSTLASLWQVDDEATFEIMQQFYQVLANSQGLSKAKALQTVQKSMLRDRPEFDHPYFWAPFILFGNWL